MYYKKVCCLQKVKHVQLQPEYEPWNIINIDWIVGEIVLGSQCNLQGGYVFERLLTGKCLRKSHWTPVNITEDTIERYETFNTRGCPDKLIFGDFNDQPIPSNYYNFLNDGDDDGNNIPGTPVYYDLLYNEGVEYSFIPNDKYIKNGIIIGDDDRLASDIYPLQN